MTTAGGGWTLAIGTADANALTAGNAVWHNATPDNGIPSPTAPGKTAAYGNVAGKEVLFKTHSEQAGYWSQFNMPAPSTLLALVGTGNISANVMV